MPKTTPATRPNMPPGLQLITFALERDEDVDLGHWVWMDVKVHDTVAKIAARRGNPDDIKAILKRNDIRSARTVLRHKKSASKKARKRDLHRIQVPKKLRAKFSFSVVAGDEPPKVTGGYAKLSIVDRPERVGLTDFDGYDPITLEVPIRFLAASRRGGPADIENDIDLLEKMAGRGKFEGAAVGPPPVIRLTTSDNNGDVVPLIPRNYQWPGGPLWRVAGIDWDTSASGCWRQPNGYRTMQKATVTLQQHTAIRTATRSAAARRRGKKKKRAAN